MEDCLFCKIVNREVPAEIVYENEKVIAFKDINPAAPVHILVIPKRHYASLNDVRIEEMGIIEHIFKEIPKIAESQGIKESGYRIIMNCGKDSGQEVKHIHFHILGGKTLGEKISG